MTTELKTTCDRCGTLRKRGESSFGEVGSIDWKRRFDFCPPCWLLLEKIVVEFAKEIERA